MGLIGHQSVNELIAAFALDAVPRTEHERIAAHLNECPCCREELDAFRAVAAAMADSLESLPGGLWLRVSRQLTDAEVR